MVRVTYILKMAEISSGRSLKPNISREMKLGYILLLQRLKKLFNVYMYGMLTHAKTIMLNHLFIYI